MQRLGRFTTGIVAALGTLGAVVAVVLASGGSFNVNSSFTLLGIPRR